jgi:CheY-like chemotaxis protein
VTPDPGWVLVVHHDLSDGIELVRLLEREGHHATLVDDRGAAVELLRAEPFDLVLLADAQAVDGPAPLEEGRAGQGCPGVPVIAIAGRVDPALVRERVHAALAARISSPSAPR